MNITFIGTMTKVFQYSMEHFEKGHQVRFLAVGDGNGTVEAVALALSRIRDIVERSDAVVMNSVLFADAVAAEALREGCPVYGCFAPGTSVGKLAEKACRVCGCDFDAIFSNLEALAAEADERTVLTLLHNDATDRDYARLLARELAEDGIVCRVEDIHDLFDLDLSKTTAFVFMHHVSSNMAASFLRRNGKPFFEMSRLLVSGNLRDAIDGFRKDGSVQAPKDAPVPIHEDSVHEPEFREPGLEPEPDSEPGEASERVFVEPDSPETESSIQECGMPAEPRPRRWTFDAKGKIRG